MEVFNDDGASRASGTARKDWLYVSRKLALEWLPSTLAGPVVLLGDTPYYRLTLPVLVWLENAVATLDDKRPGPDQVAVVIDAQEAIYCFAREQWSDQQRDAARALGPKPLPEPEWCPVNVPLPAQRLTQPRVFDFASRTSQR